MKAISVRQPWAWAILHAGKDVENRTWKTKYRGPVLIHAGAKIDKAGYDWIFRKTGRYPPPSDALPTGGIVGVARIYGCASYSLSLWFLGPYGFLLSDTKPIPFKQLKGRLGLFEVEYGK